MTTKPDLTLPPGNTAVSVKMINPVNFGPAILKRFMAPDVPGLETFPTSPSLSFLIEHPSGRKLVWDLGIRKDYANYAPKIADYIPTTKYDINVTKSVIEILEENGVSGNDVEAVIWSHWHWDHIGDPSTFPPSTDLVVGQGFKEAMLPGYPANPDSPLRESDYRHVNLTTRLSDFRRELTMAHSGRNLREITFRGSGSEHLNIGEFPAFDYFGDGSFYLLDSPGHAVGHLCGLARTTTSPATFILLGGDVCHYAGIMRPSRYLPVPESISPHPCRPHEVGSALCPGGAWEELQRSRGREPTDSLFEATFGLDVPLAMKTVGSLQQLDCNEDVFVIIAHDSTVRDAVPHFPVSLNEWKEKGWGHGVKWAFLRDLKSYWECKGVA